jgi:acyl carrier protein
MNREEKLQFLKESLIQMGVSDERSHSINEFTLLSELDLDSLDIVELQIFYEEKTGNITADPDYPPKSVRELLDLIHDKFYSK